MGLKVPGTPAHEWTRGFMDDMCRRSPAPKPPAPKKQFTGGQCECVPYAVVFRVVYPNGTTTANNTVNRTGKISLGAKVNFSNGTSAFQLISQNCSTNPPTQIISNIGQHFTVDRGSLVIVSVTRTDGLVDNCGDPPVDYPPAPSLPIPPPPVPYVPPQVDKPGNGWNINVPFVFVKADGTVNVDVGGINFNFDAGGVNFNIENNFGNGSPGSGSGSTEPPDLSGLEQKIEQAKNAAEQAKNAAEQAKKIADDRANNDGDDPQNDPNKQEKEERGEDDPKEEAGVERLLAVKVDITQRPSNARSQWGDGSPNVYYCGWFEFSTKGTPHPRNPIHFDSNYFIAPVGADGFAYTVYNGFRAKHTIIRAKVRPSG